MFRGLGRAIGGVAGMMGDMTIAPVAEAIRGVPLEGPNFTVAGMNGGRDAGEAVGVAIFVRLICYLFLTDLDKQL